MNSQTEAATTKLLHAKSNATIKHASSLGLTAASSDFLDLDIQIVKVRAKEMSRQPPERHRTPQEINMVTKMVPRGLQRALQVRSRGPQDSQRAPKRLPKGDQNLKKSLLEAIWAPQEK